MCTRLLARASCLFLLPLLPPQEPGPAEAHEAAPARTLQTRCWQVDGDRREALVHVPPAASREPVPLVFVFHGHGGSMAGIARSFDLHTAWPEAVVVYPQGLPTATGRDPDGRRAGWQNRAGADGDRDLHFVDTMLAALQDELRIDPDRVHATGHSNGGGFTYLLLAQRSEVFASVAPSAAGAGGAAPLRNAGAAPPRPVLHLAGRRDTVVPFAQQQRTIAALIAAHDAGPAEPWPAVPGVQLHRAADGGHVATLLHDGTHRFPAAAPATITRFFQATPRPNPWVTAPERGPGLVQHVYASPLVGREVSYHVYLPPGFGDDPQQRYPVVYWLHGSGGGASGLRVVAARFDAAITRGLVPPLLVVFPNGLANGMWCDAEGGGAPVESVVLDEILPRIDSLFPTRGSRDGRLVAGFSMGGYGALRFCCRRPGTFAGGISLAGGPLQQDFTAAPRVDEARRLQVLRAVYGGDLAVFRRQSPWQLASERQAELQRGPRLAIWVGEGDETLAANRALHEHLQSLVIPHEYAEFADVGHDAPRLLQAIGPRFWSFVGEVLGEAR